MNPTLCLNIGSNTGDRRAFIARAVARISACPLFGGAAVTCSDDIETEAWGYSSSQPFINTGALISFTSPFKWNSERLKAILRALQSIERELSDTPHRNSDGTYRDREIDIDIIAADDFVCDTPELTVPHPRMHLRSFVLLPMAQLTPQWRHPQLHETAAELLSHLKQ